jgi:hypothetical protein
MNFSIVRRVQNWRLSWIWSDAHFASSRAILFCFFCYNHRPNKINIKIRSSNGHWIGSIEMIAKLIFGQDFLMRSRSRAVFLIFFSSLESSPGTSWRTSPTLRFGFLQLNKMIVPKDPKEAAVDLKPLNYESGSGAFDNKDSKLKTPNVPEQR